MKPAISYSDFEKLDLRIGTVLKAEEVPGSKKLLQFLIDLGPEEGKKTILSGIKGLVEMEKLIGTQVLVLANLEPKKMMGLESRGMILMGVWQEEDREEIALLIPQKKVFAGTPVE